MAEQTKTPEELKKLDDWLHAAIGHPDKLFIFRDHPDLAARVGRGFQGKMDDHERGLRTKTLIEEAHTAVINSKEKAFDALMRCYAFSWLSSLLAVAKMGLSPNLATQEVNFIAYDGIVKPSIGYRGFIAIMLRSGAVSSIETVPVYGTEPFRQWSDEHGRHIEHVPDYKLSGQKDKLVAVYCLIHMTAGGPAAVEVMNKAEIDKCKACSKGSDSKFSPWTNWYVEMARKTVVRRAAKWKDLCADPVTAAQYRIALACDNDDYDLDGQAEAAKAREAGSRRLLAQVRGERLEVSSAPADGSPTDSASPPLTSNPSPSTEGSV